MFTGLHSVMWVCLCISRHIHRSCCTAMAHARITNICMSLFPLLFLPSIHVPFHRGLMWTVLNQEALNASGHFAANWENRWKGTDNEFLCDHARVCIYIYRRRSLWIWCHLVIVVEVSSFQSSLNKGFDCIQRACTYYQKYAYNFCFWCTNFIHQITQTISEPVDLLSLINLLCN